METLDLAYFRGTQAEEIAQALSRQLDNDNRIRVWAELYTCKDRDSIKLKQHVEQAIFDFDSAGTLLIQTWDSKILSIDQFTIISNFLLRKRAEYLRFMVLVGILNDQIGKIVMENIIDLRDAMSDSTLAQIYRRLNEAAEALEKPLSTSSKPRKKKGPPVKGVKILQTICDALQPMISFRHIDRFRHSYYWLRCCNEVDKTLATRYDLSSLLDYITRSKLTYNLKEARRFQKTYNIVLKKINARPLLRTPNPNPKDVEQLLNLIYGLAKLWSGYIPVAKAVIDENNHVGFALESIEIPFPGEIIESQGNGEE